VALVSGRDITTLDRLFAPLVLATIGCHGAEWRPSPDSRPIRRRPPLDDETRAALRNTAADLPRIQLEDKTYTIAFHYRNAPEQRETLEQRLRELVCGQRQLRLLCGKSVFEVKGRDFDKGEAIGELMREPAFAHRRPVFLGDDTTDEDAFAVVRELCGVCISVGRLMPETDLMLPNPKAARLWLAGLAGVRKL